MENQEINFGGNNNVYNKEALLNQLNESHIILESLEPETEEHLETKALLTKVKSLLTKTV